MMQKINIVHAFTNKLISYKQKKKLISAELILPSSMSEVIGLLKVSTKPLTK